MARSEWIDNKLINQNGFTVAEVIPVKEHWVAKVMCGDYTPDDYTVSWTKWKFSKEKAIEWAEAMMIHTCYIGHCCDYCYAKKCDHPSEKRMMYTLTERLHDKQGELDDLEPEEEKKVPFVDV